MYIRLATLSEGLLAEGLACRFFVSRNADDLRPSVGLKVELGRELLGRQRLYPADVPGRRVGQSSLCAGERVDLDFEVWVGGGALEGVDDGEVLGGSRKYKKCKRHSRNVVVG